MKKRIFVMPVLISLLCVVCAGCSAVKRPRAMVLMNAT